MAIGGSTNAIIHLVAMAGRAGIKLPLEKFDEISRRTPRLADLRPAGRFLMEDFYFAGGLRALLAQLPDLLHGESFTVNGHTLAENLAGAEIFNPEVIRTRETALAGRRHRHPARKSLPARRGHQTRRDGAALPPPHRPGGRLPRLRRPRRAHRRSRAADVTADSVIVLQNAGPIGAPGMPEWGMLPIPKKLLEAGVRDMLRISDARMSGTSYGACVLHVAPESAIGGPLALVRDGDLITLDVPARTLTLEVSERRTRRSQSRHGWKGSARPSSAATSRSS